MSLLTAFDDCVKATPDFPFDFELFIKRYLRALPTWIYSFQWAVIIEGCEQSSEQSSEQARGNYRVICVYENSYSFTTAMRLLELTFEAPASGNAVYQIAISWQNLNPSNMDLNAHFSCSEAYVAETSRNLLSAIFAL